MDEKYIPLSAAIEAVHKRCDEVLVWDESGEETADCIEDVLLAIEPADVRPVERSTWKRIEPPGYGYVCGKCGRWEPWPEPFCNCGADMRPEPGKEQANE